MEKPLFSSCRFDFRQEAIHCVKNMILREFQSFKLLTTFMFLISSLICILAAFNAGSKEESRNLYRHQQHMDDETVLPTCVIVPSVLGAAGKFLTSGYRKIL